MNSPLRKLLEQYRQAAKSEREKGTYFERLAVAFVKHDPGMAQEYEDAWLFSDWAKANEVRASDTGIDAVAKVRGEDTYCAIQCKFFREGYRIQKGDIDSFLSSSQLKPFTRGLIIDTTGAPWSANAEEMLEPLNIQRIGLDRLEASPIDWLAWFEREEVHVAPSKQLRPHQRDALQCIRDGLAEADRGKLIMACGTGKTFTGLKIAEDLVGIGGQVLVLVPSLALMSQTIREWTIDSGTPLRSYAICSDAQVGKRRRDRGDVAEVDIHDLDYPATTNAVKLATRAAKAAPDRMTVVFATYQSIQVVSDAQKLSGLPEFDLIICDEAHRTTGATLAGEDESNFVKVHNQDFIAAQKRLYMTATPRVFGDAVKAKATEAEAVLASMDNELLFGKTLFTRGFGWAVENGLLTDYKVLVLAVDEAMVSGGVQARLADGGSELKLDDATKIIGCYKALIKSGLKEELAGDWQPMRRALAFAKDIASSKLIRTEFAAVVSEYIASDEGEEALGEAPALECQLAHVDGTMGAKERNTLLDWLKEDAGDATCRILTNARCLSEGVDVPALDAILFMHPRKSQIDVVQSVGRVMRRAPGKRMGYVILPIGVPAGMTPEEALADNERYRVVWQILNALRSHDERFDAMINKADLGVDVSDHIEVIAVSNRLPERKETAKAKARIGHGTSVDDDERADGDSRLRQREAQAEFGFDEFTRAIMAKIVKKCGRRDYWEDWAGDIAKIAQTHINRITGLVEKPGTPEREAFERFLAEIKDDLNEGIGEGEAVEMLAQHLITKPVFEALFDDYSFAQNNPVSKALEGVLETLEGHNIDKEAESLRRFYASVKRRAEGVDNDAAKQKIIVELYDKFFRNAFPTMTERLGIVYTPVEIVDFILRSVDELLQSEFGQTLGSEGVHILDPFTGTGTFITRLIQSGLVKPEELERKYAAEIHANELVLLAYYIAAINIEAAYHDIMGGEYRPFDGMCLTDTFQLYEQDKDLLAELMPDNSTRRSRQKELPVRVVVGNPPYFEGQDSGGESVQGVSYPKLDARIRQTYGARSTADLQNSLFNSYVRALRWASDRIGNQGIVAFVSAAGWVTNNSFDGFRKSLVDEFSSIHVFHLRGNQRTAGERSRREGGKVFGSGSRAPIAITLLVKNPSANEQGRIHFYDIGDYLTREQKLATIRQLGSIGGITARSGWRSIAPDEHGDWLAQRSSSFHKFLLSASKEKPAPPTLFSEVSSGIKTNRDAWCYNPSESRVSQNMERMIGFYNEELGKYSVRFSLKKNKPDPERVVANDDKKIKWTREIYASVKSGRLGRFDQSHVVRSNYRPFTPAWAYFDRHFNNCVYQMPTIFPYGGNPNRVIAFTGPGSPDFSAIMCDSVPNYDFQAKGLCLPRYVYEELVPPQKGGLFATEAAPRRRDAITDAGLAHFQRAYPGEKITKDDLFSYVYGLFHSADYRERFSANLSKELPRIPVVRRFEDFRAFVVAGERLGDLHRNYDEAELFPISIAQGDLRLANIADPVSYYRVEKMRFGGKRPNVDKTTISYNSRITITGVPIEAYDYVVNGKPAIEWVMERQAVKKDSASGIVWDANNYANETMGDPAYPLRLLQRVIAISLETVSIVRSLPELDIGGPSDSATTTLRHNELRSAIVSQWSDTPGASAALAIVDGLLAEHIAPETSLRVTDILRLLGKEEVTEDLIAALAILTQSEFAIFKSRGELVDEGGQRYDLSPDEFDRVLMKNIVLHPRTREEMPGAADRVFPIFDLTAELVSLGGDRA